MALANLSASRREQMVRDQLAGRGIRDPAVLQAMARVPREPFVPPDLRDDAYADAPLPIAAGQTISQPYVVALMLEALSLDARDRVLEVGAGSGYVAAVLGLLVAEVHALERHGLLAQTAHARLARLGYGNVHIIHADGAHGWALGAPFDAIVVSAGGEEIPPALLGQLAEGGRLVIPVGRGPDQVLWRVERQGDRDRRERLGRVSFVPLRAGLPRRDEPRRDPSAGC